MSEDRAAIRGLELPGASISVLAVTRSSGDVLAAASPARALAPASNTKLLTAGLALDHLGPGYRYETRIVGDGSVVDGRLDGDLVLVGSGAPDVDAAALSTLAGGVSAQLDRVAGDLLVDGTRFAGGWFGPGWTRGDQRHYYGAPSSAVALAGNLVTVTVRPVGGGDPPAVSVSPGTPAVAVDAEVTVTPEATADDLRAYTDPDSGDVVVRGALPPDAGDVQREVPIHDPERHAGLALRSVLAEEGVRIDGTVRVLGEQEAKAAARVGAAGSGATGDSGVAAVRSAPVRDLVREMNVTSDNFVAEQLARTVAREVENDGSWGAWEAVVSRHFADLGVETVRVRDGSGLSRYNLLPARGLIEHLRWVDDQPWADAFFDSLPAPGEGTLSSRLDGVAVTAKTGTITGTSALSGLLRRDNAPDVLFCVIHGGLTSEGSDAAREAQDAFVRWLADT